MTLLNEHLIFWVKFFLVAAAIPTTAFPILYALTAWSKSWLGRALMFQAVAFAFAVDINLVFRLYKFESVEFRYWLGILAYALISLGTAALTWTMIRYNFRQDPNKETEYD